MDQRTEPIRQDIDSIRDSMTEKMEQIESKVRGQVEQTTETVRRVFDVKGQIAERPWMAVGASILAGYMLGNMGNSGGSNYSHRSDQPPMRYTGSNYQYQPESSSMRYASYSPYQERSPSSYSSNSHPYESQQRSQGQQHSDQEPRQRGFMDDLKDQFGGEINTLKNAAVTAMIGTLRDTLQRSMPQFGREYERVRQERGSTAQSPSNPNNPSFYETTSTAHTTSQEQATGTPNTEYRSRNI